MAMGVSLCVPGASFSGCPGVCMIMCSGMCLSVCVSVCVCVRERECVCLYGVSECVLICMIVYDWNGGTYCTPVCLPCGYLPG